MSTSWISKPIICQDQEISPGLDWESPLFPYLAEVTFKICLVMKSWEMLACEGRQLSPEDFDLMERYAERLNRRDLDEGSLRTIVDDFGADLFDHLQGSRIKVDSRALA